MLTTLPHFTIDMGVGGHGVAWRGPRSLCVSLRINTSRWHNGMFETFET